MWGLMTVKGGFREFRGEGKVVDSGALSDRVDIGAASLHAGIGRRDEHLRSADFFDVEKFLEISVIVTAATADKDTVDLGADVVTKGCCTREAKRCAIASARSARPPAAGRRPSWRETLNTSYAVRSLHMRPSRNS